MCNLLSKKWTLVSRKGTEEDGCEIVNLTVGCLEFRNIRKSSQLIEDGKILIISSMYLLYQIGEQERKGSTLFLQKFTIFHNLKGLFHRKEAPYLNLKLKTSLTESHL